MDVHVLEAADVQGADDAHEVQEPEVPAAVLALRLQPGDVSDARDGCFGFLHVQRLWSQVMGLSGDIVREPGVPTVHPPPPHPPSSRNFPLWSQNVP